MTLEIEKNKDYVKVIFPNDLEYKRLRLLVTLSPILIASFDNGRYELEFLKNSIEKSKFPYALYPNFFQGFSIENYRKYYANYNPAEDVFLNKENNIEFIINQMDNQYINALTSIIENVIIDPKANYYFTDYFKEIRNDIVINGRRSILTNGIQGFYLSKYVVVWMIDIINFIKENNPKAYEDLKIIEFLANNLKTPRILSTNFEENQ
ncbi:hypothetical protein [Anaerococcus sp. Marseille-P9784]|uniref:hypothetical protein n=1 Tax=Anaerococcus sp. Marseille-P9784 TaxID=2614127 RepID=UPI00124A13E3|nr:hypothetical protein [Anaerococcus sp. Marseille-P9784]